MTTFQVQISVAPVPPGLGFEARDFIIATDDLLRKQYGGSCLGVIEGGTITLEAQTDSKAEFVSMIEAYCSHFRVAQRQVEILVVESPVGSLSADERAAGGRLNTTGKLTKSFLMDLPAGSFVASHDITGNFEPLFAEPIECAESRPAQWNRIRTAGVNQRACHVFPSRAHFKEWQRQALEFFRAKAR